MSGFNPRLEILAPAQRALWPRLAEVPPGFALYGGTGLALRLGHRESMDFDLFASDPFDPGELLGSLKLLRGGEVAQREANTLSVWIKPDGADRAVKLSLFGGLGFPVIDPQDVAPDNGLPIASLRDLAATKCAALLARVEVKDYQDVAALVQSGMSLSEVAACAAAVYPGQIDQVFLLSTMTYFEGEAAVVPVAVRRVLLAAANGVGPGLPPRPTYLSISAACEAARAARGSL